MNWHLDPEVDSIVEYAAGQSSPLHERMTDAGRDRGFPIIGPSAGATLSLLAAAVEARRVFEFGSGFGYSAAWFLDALPADGSIVLTDFEESNLESAREFLADHQSSATVEYEAGDAIETFREYSGPFDVILIDLRKSQYPDAFDHAVDALAPGGLLIADDILSGPVTPSEVNAALSGERVASESVRGIAAYLERIREADGLRSTVLPIGDGLAISLAAHVD